MNILAVLGSSFFRHLLQRHLGFLPQPPMFAASIAEAQVALNSKIDLVCLERHLPDGSGFDLARALRKHPETSRVPIILLTSSVDPEVCATSLEAGITEVFSKYELERLADYVEQRMRRNDATEKLIGKALLVEDSVPVARFIRSVLERLGLRVDTCPSGEQALESLEAKTYDIALIDVLLEGRMTGLNLVREIRRSEGRNTRVPILAMSALEDMARRIELLREGANDFLAKPMLEEELAARVRNMVQLKHLLDETEAQRDHMRRLAMTDQLTGLFNRHYLAEIASRRITEAGRHKIPVTMLMLDIDHFKNINDTHGHDIGDMVLAETAAVIKDCCREGDVAARTGGEEFVLLLINTVGERALAFAEDLRGRVEARRPGGIPVTVSVGVAETATGAPTTFEALFKAADDALYDAKETGRNRVVKVSL
ncbi:MAG: diguanylate cyclase [Rhodocyclaceae bacterium]|jgi:two-component system cell cycle response regulator|nr:diguanylate cyclase [Rhodocyclaceae bacterium]MCL4756870.1 diguanylate cyclase [Rhodocyclaceae bacterium]